VGSFLVLFWSFLVRDPKETDTRPNKTVLMTKVGPKETEEVRPK
jgi:hypothetical protein